jgi:replicative DNA helicase
MARADFYKVKKASNEQIEELIVVGLILDTRFAQRIVKKINTEHISSRHLRILCQWCLNYVSKYGKAPKREIEEIFEVESSQIDEDKADQIKSVLESLSERYTDKTANTEYVYNQAIAYLDKQEILIRARNSIQLAEKGLVDKARNEIREYNEIRKDLTDNGVFLTPENFYRIIDSENDTGIMRLPGALGNLIGGLKRGWLVSFIGPMKRGKTFHLVDWAIEAYLQGLKVVLFSLEMTEQDIDKRMMSALVGKPFEDKAILLPVFDCKANQENTCHKDERTCSVGLVDEEGNLPFFEDADEDYVVCTACRNSKENKKFYVPTSWYIAEAAEKIKWDDIDPKKKRNKLIYKNPKNFRRFCPPIGSVPFSYIEDVLSDLALSEGFTPDIIVLDYADLLASTLKSELRHQLDDIWKSMARMAVNKEAIVLTASQTNRGAMNVRTISEDSSAEDIRKNAHVSVMIGINQYKKLKEKERGLIRLNLMYHRYKETPAAECLTTNNLSICRVCVDTMLVIPEETEYIYVGG